MLNTIKKSSDKGINKKLCFLGLMIFSLLTCTQETIPESEYKASKTHLNLEQANRLVQLPLNCIQTPLPYKSGHTIAKESDLNMPQIHHPAFYGCFDWHSAVHGHWSLVYLLKTFPQIEESTQIKEMLSQNLSKENIEKELEYFSMNKYTSNFERTYGWTWLLKLAEELTTWDDPLATQLSQNLEPLCDYIIDKYITYLPKLVYPIRVGEHSNTAFGISFAYDYAVTTKNKELSALIEKRAKDFYSSDTNCPIDWEPSGYDFLSPCLEEAFIMSKVLQPEQFTTWFSNYLPNFFSKDSSLIPAEVSDRSDGKLVHLDGLNFSRAWCLYSIAGKLDDKNKILQLADQHLDHSLSNIVDGDYMGEHWLASFALYALKCKSEVQ